MWLIYPQGNPAEHLTYVLDEAEAEQVRQNFEKSLNRPMQKEDVPETDWRVEELRNQRLRQYTWMGDA